LLKAGFTTQQWWLVGAILFASLITLFIIAKIWAAVVWKDKPESELKTNFRYFANLSNVKKTQMIAPIIFLSLVSLYIGFGAEHIQQLSSRIATELMDNQQYVEAVLHNTQILK